MQIYFAGAESPSHLQLLKQCGVTRVAISVSNLTRHVKKPIEWATKQRLDGIDWVVYADSPVTLVDPALELIGGAEVQPEWVCGPAKWAETTWLRDSDLGFLPIWDGGDSALLRELVEDYEGIVLPDSVVDNQVSVRTARAALPPLGVLGGLTGRSKGIERFDMLVSSAWWAVQKHGETQVWNGSRLIRLNSDDKHAKRARYVDAIAALGCNVSAVLSDDPTETCRLAILSWQALEAHVNALGRSKLPAVVTSHPSNGTAYSAPQSRGVASAPAQTRHDVPASAGLRVLPLMGTLTMTSTREDADGNEVAEDHTTIESSAKSARMCSTCVLSSACPSFTPGAECAYQIPVVMRTKDQRHEVMRALAEMQTQRIMFGAFSEQVLGTPDAQVGKEIDRLYSILERARSIEDEHHGFRVSVEASGDQAAGLGVISRLFGTEAGLNARALERPMLVDEIIEEADMVDHDG